MPIDYTKLSRNYKNKPLDAKELVPLEDLKYLYVECNLCFQDIGEIIGKSANTVGKQCKKAGLTKSKEQQKQSIENRYIRKLGVKNPAQLISSQQKMKQTMLEKYGVDNASKNEKIKEKRKQTCIQKYGVDNASKNIDVKNKTKTNNRQKYNVDYPTQLEETKQKIKQTNNERYGVDAPLQNADIREKIEQTNLQRYGHRNAFQNKYIRNKYNNIIKEKYDVNNVSQTDDVKQAYKNTCQNKYGYNNTLQVPEFKEKTKQTNLDKYGVDNVSKSLIIQQKIVNTIQEHYDTDVINVMQIDEVKQKVYETKKQNGTLNSSSCEIQILHKLQSKFKDVKTQYKSKLYPFACDFYIPELDLYMEYQGFFTHGTEPYDVNNIEHEKIVQKWKQLSTQTNFKQQHKHLYEIALDVWTVKDPLKRKTAKENNLNWIEFFTIKQFYQWFEVI